MLKSLKGWLNNFFGALEKPFRAIDEDMKKMSPEDRELFLRLLTEHQFSHKNFL